MDEEAAPDAVNRSGNGSQNRLRQERSHGSSQEGIEMQQRRASQKNSSSKGGSRSGKGSKLSKPGSGFHQADGEEEKEMVF